MPKKIIIDTDIGDDIDDAIALALALGSPELEVLGVTVVYGDVVTRARIARKLIRAWGRTDIPVIAGFERPLAFQFHPGTAPAACSQRDSVRADDPCLSRAQTAPDFIASTVRRFPGEVTILTIGAKTNVAAALCLDPQLASQVAGICSNVGYLPPSEATPEWNARYDPLALRILAQSGAPWTVLGIDVCRHLGMRREELTQLAGSDLPQSQVLRELILLYKQHKGSGDPPIKAFEDVTNIWVSDTDTVFAMLHAEAITYRSGRIEVGLGGELHFQADVAGPHRWAVSALPEKYRVELLERILGRWSPAKRP